MKMKNGVGVVRVDVRVWYGRMGVWSFGLLAMERCRYVVFWWLRWNGTVEQ